MSYNNSNTSTFGGMEFDLSNYSNDYESPAWNDTDTSQYLFDSPQPESRPLPQETTPPQQPYDSKTPVAAQKQAAKPQSSQLSQPPNGASTSALFSMPSSASESSDHSSSSASSAQKKRKSSRSSTPSDIFAGTSFVDSGIPQSAAYQDDKLFSGSTNYDTMYTDMNDTTFSGHGLDSLTLDTVNSNGNAPMVDFAGNGSPNFGNRTMQNHNIKLENHGFPAQYQSNSASPMNTIQPSQTTFMLNQSREESPMIFNNSNTSSPGAFAAHGSPFNSSNAMNNNDLRGGAFQNSPMTLPMHGVKQEASSVPTPASKLSTGMSIATPQSTSSICDKWPCKMEVAPTPDKSRVETQIPIELKLYNIPAGIHKLHLPAHTISKPKFQAKPPHQKSPEIAELTAYLVCASAMEKDNMKEKAFERGAHGNIFVPHEENQPAATKVQTDDPDPDKPLNGGPVSICSGCINRERKRAARKKTKKQEEEDEWAKDEAKRVIVFNCPEVREWSVEGTKEVPVADHDGPIECAIVRAPMRIACYCRHQNEKLGFQVVFTLRNSKEEIIAQAMSQSIMITDDHKQPGQGQAGYGAFGQPMMPFGQQFPQMQEHMQRQPQFNRNSFSSNDLVNFANQQNTNYRNQYAPQRGPPPLSRRTSSGYGSTIPSTASATPRNLSRPASPTNDLAAPAKKRRAGSGHSKVPSGLTMTRMENNFSPTSAPGPMNIPNSNFNNAAPHGFGRIGASVSPSGATDTYSSGPSTPLFAPNAMNPNTGAFGNNIPADFQFYSAPTSQQPSRAASPNALSRQNTRSANASKHTSQQYSFGGGNPMTQQPNIPPNFLHQNQNQQNQNHQVAPNALTAALSSLPHFNPKVPPMISKIIPHYGHVNGGEEVTILGQGFFEGLEVCFGDVVAPPGALKMWSDNTMILRCVPGASDEGQVAVVFKHQHPKFSKSEFRELVRMQGVMPTTQVLYTYLDDDRAQMQQLEVAVREQQIHG